MTYEQVIQAIADLAGLNSDAAIAEADRLIALAREMEKDAQNSHDRALCGIDS